jgi:hypothetical protein
MVQCRLPHGEKIETGHAEKGLDKKNPKMDF